MNSAVNKSRTKAQITMIKWKAQMPGSKIKFSLFIKVKRGKSFS